MAIHGEETPSTLPLELHIDRLALQATRTQIQLLIDTVRSRDSELVVTRNALDNLQLENEEIIYANREEYENQIAAQQNQINELNNQLSRQMIPSNKLIQQQFSAVNSNENAIPYITEGSKDASVEDSQIG